MQKRFEIPNLVASDGYLEKVYLDDQSFSQDDIRGALGNKARLSRAKLGK